ncbi:MAG: hypothetical protein P8X42_08120 [Calditrichaceae bacterium]
MDISFNNVDTYGSMTVFDNTHDLSAGFPSTIPVMNATSFYNINDAGTEVLIGRNSYASVAVKDIGAGRVVVLGYDYYDYDEYASRLIANAVQSAVKLQWISAYPVSGFVNPGEQIETDINVNTEELSGGDYAANIIVQSNDPDEAEITIPVSLKVNGRPNISVKPEMIFFDSTAINDSTMAQFQIMNKGSEPLQVTDMLIDDMHFSVDFSPLTLNSGESHNIN